MYVCGSNAHGQLGVGSKVTTVDTFTPVPSLKVCDVACGPDVTYAISVPDGRVVSSGRLSSQVFRPLHKFEGVKCAVSIVGSANEVIVLEADGKVHACSSIPIPNVLQKPRVLPMPLKCIQVAAGSLFSLFLLETGEVFSLGDNSYGVLGLGIEDDKRLETIPKQIGGLVGITSIACGGFHAIAKSTDGQLLYSWGRNDHGQLGLNCFDNKSSPTVIPSSFAGNPVAEIACGDYHTLVLLRDGVVLSCGKGSQGQLGLGTTSDTAGLTPVSLPEPCKKIAAGGGYNNAHSLALSASNVYGWGSNSKGQLGLSSTSTPSSLVPVVVPVPFDVSVMNPRCGWLHTVLVEPLRTSVASRERYNPALGTLTIPYDALVHIYSYFGDAKEMCRLCRVSSVFREVSGEDLLWEPIFRLTFATLYDMHHHKVTPESGWRALYRHEIIHRGDLIRPRPEESVVSKVKGWFWKKAPPKARIIMCGLDAAGKTTMLYKMKLGEVVTTIPTIGFNVETVDYKETSITVWDVGGPDKLRPLWRHYYQGCRALVWVIDGNDRDRCEHAAEELEKTLREDELRDAAILIFWNKMDLPRCMPVAEGVDRLGLHRMLHNRRWFIQPCCAVSGDGLQDGFDWLRSVVVEK